MSHNYTEFSECLSSTAGDPGHFTQHGRLSDVKRVADDTRYTTD